MQTHKHKTLADAVAGRYSVDSNGCWIWIGARRRGYGIVWFGGKAIGAHRAMFESVHGAIPMGAMLCHRCDVGVCINPDHLFLGSQKDNMRDALSKGRMKHNHTGQRFCKRGHEFTAANTREYRGMRSCRECERLRGISKYQRRKSKRNNDASLESRGVGT